MNEILDVDENDLKEMGISREEYIRMVSDMNDQLVKYESNHIIVSDQDQFKTSAEDQRVNCDEIIAEELENELPEQDKPIINQKHFSKKARKRMEKKQCIANIKTTPSEFVSPTQFWPNYEEIIRKRIVKYFPTQIQVVKITNITNQNLLHKFKASLESETLRVKKEQSGINIMKSIELSLHGTESANIDKIIENGLLIPGQGNDLKVRNGQAGGFGIYVTLTDPTESIHYFRGGGKMLACAVLLSNRFIVSHCNDFAVIRDESFVLPCFLVEFTEKWTNK